jgi:predicted metal-dependent phosphoesterase TrpH
MRIDLHTHTYPASSCSQISHDQYVTFCRDQQLPAIALTNHGDVRDNLALEGRLAEIGTLLLHGVEISTMLGDFIIFSPDLEYLATLRDVRPPLRPREVPDHAAVVWAHPYAGGGRSGSVYFPGAGDQAAPVLTAIELYNGNWLEDRLVDGAHDIAAALNLPCTGGSDAHRADRLMACGTEFDEPIADTADLVRALRAGSVRPWRPPRPRSFLRRS